MRNILSSVMSASLAIARRMSACRFAAAVFITVLLAAFAPNIADLVRDQYSETFGEIYVESPQVFTRERLATDRAQHNAWLQKVLAAVKIEEISASQAIENKKAIDIRAHGSSGTKASTAGEEKPKVAQDLAFAFSAANYIREIVRQEIIANQLDDRHDHQGTTLLQLKFDAAIVPGPRTRRGALIEVEVRPPKRLSSSLTLLAQNQNDDEYLESYYIDSANKSRDMHEALKFLEVEFDRFRAAFGLRLKKRFQSVSASLAKLPARDDESIELGLETNRVAGVLLDRSRSLPSGSDANAQMAAAKQVANYLIRFERTISTYFDENQFERPELAATVERFVSTIRRTAALPSVQWDQLELKLQIRYIPKGKNAFPLDVYLPITIRKTSCPPEKRKERKSCPIEMVAPDGRHKTFDANAGSAQIYPFLDLARAEILGTAAEPVFYRASGGCADALSAADQYEFVASLSDGQRESNDGIVIGPSESGWRHQFTPSKQFWATAFKHSPPLSNSDKEFVFGIYCEGDVVPARVPISFFKFVQAAKSAELYTYALMPRAGVFLKTKESDFDSEGSSSIAKHKVAIRAQERTVVSDAGVKITGFAESAAADDSGTIHGPIRFGWVLTPNDGRLPIRQREFLGPSQHALSAIVRVPAWWDSLFIQITTSWIREEGSAKKERQFGYAITYSRDFESLEKLVGLRASKPFVFVSEMPAELQLDACEPAQIAIRGERLWKAGAVLLNDVMAKEISVLPDMRGILASFDKGAIRGGPDAGAGTARGMGLYVYTTEGVVKVDIPMKIRGMCK